MGEWSCLLPHIYWELVFGIDDLTEEVGFKFCIKGQFCRDQNGEDDTKCPNISCLTQVGLLSGQIWVHVLWSSAMSCQLLVKCAFCCKTKIYQLDFSFLIDENVIELQIPLHH